ncbi:MAG TPA: hypothetical protein VKO20_07290, partial [Desulfosalsimonadaceae bacterium]|nr:hypothetical protein [Desulfosalsimonadaceae bacterium]
MQNPFRIVKIFAGHAAALARCRIYLGKDPAGVAPGSLILFPFHRAVLQCGITGIVAIKPHSGHARRAHTPSITGMLKRIKQASEAADSNAEAPGAPDYLGGEQEIEDLYATVRSLKTGGAFSEIFLDSSKKQELSQCRRDLEAVIDRESRRLDRLMGRLPAAVVAVMSGRIERLKDAAWCLKTELLDNMDKVAALVSSADALSDADCVVTAKNINAVLNSIDRREVRGRDSAGISLLFVMEAAVYEDLRRNLEAAGLDGDFTAR